jgi:hypothetical protein
MPAEIVDLDALVPDDIEFHYQGGTYVLPGDIATERVFQLFKLFKELLEAQKGDDVDPEDVVKAVSSVKRVLLELFQQRDPELKEVPFGTSALPIVMQKLLQRLGVSIDEAGEASPPDGKATENRATRRRQSRTKKSPASSTSPRS